MSQTQTHIVYRNRVEHDFYESGMLVPLGGGLIAAFLTHQRTVQLKSGNDLEDAFQAWGYGFAMSLLLFFMGWIVKSFFM